MNITPYSEYLMLKIPGYVIPQFFVSKYQNILIIYCGTAMLEPLSCYELRTQRTQSYLSIHIII